MSKPKQSVERMVGLLFGEGQGDWEIIDLRPLKDSKGRQVKVRAVEMEGDA